MVETPLEVRERAVNWLMELKGVEKSVPGKSRFKFRGDAGLPKCRPKRSFTFKREVSVKEGKVRLTEVALR